MTSKETSDPPRGSGPCRRGPAKTLNDLLLLLTINDLLLFLIGAMLAYIACLLYPSLVRADPLDSAPLASRMVDAQIPARYYFVDEPPIGLTEVDRGRSWMNTTPNTVEVEGQDLPPTGMVILNRPPMHVWIVPKAEFAEPWLWVEVNPGEFVNAGTGDTTVCLDEAGTMIAPPDAIIIRDLFSCRAQCPPGFCSVCYRAGDLCWVDCVPYSPMNPGQWGDCPRSCSIDPGMVPETIEPNDMDDDKPE